MSDNATAINYFLGKFANCIFTIFISASMCGAYYSIFAATTNLLRISDFIWAYFAEKCSVFQTKAARLYVCIMCCVHEHFPPLLHFIKASMYEILTSPSLIQQKNYCGYVCMYACEFFILLFLAATAVVRIWKLWVNFCAMWCIHRVWVQLLHLAILQVYFMCYKAQVKRSKKRAIGDKGSKELS